MPNKQLNKKIKMYIKVEDLNEDEKMLYGIVGNELFGKIRKEMGGFQIYIKKELATEMDVKQLIDNGLNKQQICRMLNISFSTYGILHQKAMRIKTDKTEIKK